MLAFFWSRWPNTHAFVRLRMHARAQSRDCLSRVSAPLLRRVIIPSLLHLFRCYVTCDRESTRFSSCYVTIVLFFFPLHMCTRRPSIGNETFRRFRDRMSVVRAYARKHAPGGFSHDIAIFFTPSVRSRFWSGYRIFSIQQF